MKIKEEESVVLLNTIATNQWTIPHHRRDVGPHFLEVCSCFLCNLKGILLPFNMLAPGSLSDWCPVSRWTEGFGRFPCSRHRCPWDSLGILRWGQWETDPWQRETCQSPVGIFGRLWWSGPPFMGSKRKWFRMLGIRSGQPQGEPALRIPSWPRPPLMPLPNMEHRIRRKLWKQEKYTYPGLDQSGCVCRYQSGGGGGGRRSYLGSNPGVGLLWVAHLRMASIVWHPIFNGSPA